MSVNNKKKYFLFIYDLSITASLSPLGQGKGGCLLNIFFKIRIRACQGF
jgi:hypothetical protein